MLGAGAVFMAALAFGVPEQLSNMAAPVSGVPAAQAAAARPDGRPQRLETSTLVIHGQGGHGQGGAEESRRKHSFTIEVARTPRQQEIGMMYRTSMAADEGMLFPFPRPRLASFWMLNTYIPLDLVFIDENGRIESIISNAEPHSLEPLQSRGPVVAVLEIAGGQAEKLGLAVGDQVLHPELPKP